MLVENFRRASVWMGDCITGYGKRMGVAIL
jgi:hypothetical protein